MRSAFIIASLALTVFAAPVPSNEVELLARREFDESATTIDTTIDKRYTRTKDGRVLNGRDLPTQEIEVKRGNRDGRPRSVEKRQNRSLDRAVHNDEVEKRQHRNPYRSVDEADAEVEKRGGSRNIGRSVYDEVDAEVEKRQHRNPYRSVDEADAEVEKRGGSRNIGRSVYDEADAEVEKRGGSRNIGRSVYDEADAEVEKRGGSRNIGRSVYDGVVEMIETLKTRGFSSATNAPVREAR